jgi:hypothetical protein
VSWELEVNADEEALIPQTRRVIIPSEETIGFMLSFSWGIQ